MVTYILYYFIVFAGSIVYAYSVNVLPEIFCG